MRAGPTDAEPLLDSVRRKFLMARRLDSTLWLCVASALRVLFPQQGVFFQPVPFA